MNLASIHKGFNDEQWDLIFLGDNVSLCSKDALEDGL